MEKKVKTQITILFIIRVCLWIVAALSTLYWMYYSVKLHMDGIFAPEEYSPRLRPILYTCLVISIAAICISFTLHALSVRIRNKEN